MNPQQHFWIGNDGNIWLKQGAGAKNIGAADGSGNGNYIYQNGQIYDRWGDNGPVALGWQQIANPSQNKNITGSTGGSGSQYDTQLYDQAIRNLQSSQSVLDRERNVGLENIAGDYQNNLNRLLNAKNTTQRDYTENRTNNQIQNSKNRSQIDFETGQRANALQRLLGSKGSGSSSAARFSAPYAAALEGTQQLNQVGETYANNQSALDKSWETYLTNWNQSKDDLETQKLNQERALDQDVTNKRQSLLSKLAELQSLRALAAGGNPITASQATFDQANALNSQIADLGRQYFGRVNVADPNYTPPDLDKYSYNPRGQVGMSQNAQTQNVSPYLSLLLNGRDKERQQLV